MPNGQGSATSGSNNNKNIAKQILSGTLNKFINPTTMTADEIAKLPSQNTTNSGKNSVVNKTSALLRGAGSPLKFSTSDDDINELLLASGIANKYKNDWLHKFARVGVLDPYNALTTTKEFIFVTKPDLCLFTPGTSTINPVIARENIFVDAISNGRYTEVAKQLQSSSSNSGGPLMAILSNSVTSSLDLPGISADMIDTASNIMGTKISYRSTSMKSDEDHDFNLEFEDTKNLDVYMLFKMWDEYEKLKWNGALRFSDYGNSAQRWINYIIEKVLHDQVSIYKFVVGEDGYRIVYWARITGCVPTSVPRDAFSDMNNSEPQKITVGWRGHFVRDMDPVILAQFNQIVGGSFSDNNDLPLFNTNIHAVDGTWASTPYIYRKQTTSGRLEYYLRWKR